MTRYARQSATDDDKPPRHIAASIQRFFSRRYIFCELLHRRLPHFDAVATFSRRDAMIDAHDGFPYRFRGGAGSESDDEASGPPLILTNILPGSSKCLRQQTGQLYYARAFICEMVDTSPHHARRFAFISASRSQSRAAPRR